MKTKNTKIIISNKKLQVINEVGDEYGTLGVNAFKKISQAVGDQLKIFKSFVKVSYDNTFGLARDIYIQTKSKGGLIKGLQAAGQNLSQKNKANLKDMDTVINAQPGASDASTFLALTAPSIKGFEGLVNVVTGIEIKPGDDKNKYEKQQKKVNLAKAKASYVNLIYSVYSLENKDLKSPMQNNKDFFSKVNSSYFEEDIFKGKKEREIGLNSKAINIESYRKKSEFIENLQTIYKISQLDNKLRTKYKIKIQTSVSINNDVIKVLKLFIAKKGEDNIIKFMTNNQLSYSIISFSDQIRSLRSRARGTKSNEIFGNAFTHFKENLPEAYVSLSGDQQLFSKLTIKNNVSLIKEEKEEKEEKVDVRFYALLHSAVYHTRLYYIELTKAYVELMIQHYSVRVNKLTMEASIKGDDMAKSIEALKKSALIMTKETEYLNKEITKFNQYHKEDLEEIDSKILKTISEFNSSGLKKAKQSLDKEKDVNKKESAKAEALLSMIDSVKKSMSGDKSVEESKIFLLFYEKSIKELSDVLKKIDIDKSILLNNASSINSYFNIDISAMIEKTKNIKEFSERASKEIQKDFDKISEFTKKENDIKSVQDNAENEADSGEESQSDQKPQSGDFKKI